MESEKETTQERQSNTQTSEPEFFVLLDAVVDIRGLLAVDCFKEPEKIKESIFGKRKVIAPAEYGLTLVYESGSQMFYRYKEGVYHNYYPSEDLRDADFRGLRDAMIAKTGGVKEESK